MFYEAMTKYFKMMGLWNRFRIIDIFPVINKSQAKGGLGFSNVLVCA